MSLHGTLQDFGALETFQLIALQQKTGTLEITTEGKRRSFGFENGHLLAAHETPLRPENPLVRFLRETGYLKEEEIRAWMSLAAKQAVNPIDMLVKITDLSQEDVARIYDLFLQTALDELLSWPQGRFQFHSKKIGMPSRLVGPWKMEGLLMESMRRLDELANLLASELSPGLIPKLPAGSARPTLSDPFARALFLYVDGRRSLQEIIDGSAAAGYDLCQALRQLREDEVVELIEWVPSGLWMDNLWRKRSLWRSMLYGLAGAALLAALTIGVHALMDHFPAPWPHTQDASFLSSETRLSRAAQATAEMLEVYRLQQGYYPEDYAALADAGLLGRATRRRLERAGLEWIPSVDGSSYTWSASARAAKHP